MPKRARSKPSSPSCVCGWKSEARALPMELSLVKFECFTPMQNSNICVLQCDQSQLSCSVVQSNKYQLDKFNFIERVFVIAHGVVRCTLQIFVGLKDATESLFSGGKSLQWKTALVHVFPVPSVVGH